MRGKGINYDTGFYPGGHNTREIFDAAVVRREMQIIAEDLHCTSVRISGGDPERLSVAAEHAAAVGLEVWFAPFPVDLPPDRLLPFFTDCAERAEEVRRGGATTVLVIGCELSLFGVGFVPGETFDARLATFTTDGPGRAAALAGLGGKLNAFLAETAAAVRTRFGGPVTYASGPWEPVDWDVFDVVAVDAYPFNGRADDAYRAGLRAHLRHGKPVVATEFGCCTFTGAAALGGTGWMILDAEADTPRLKGEYVRNEAEQAACMRELLAVFEEEGLDGAFWFTFAGYALPHRPGDPAHDLDMASYGVVKMLEDGRGTAYPDMTWEPKESFHTLAAAYGA